MVKTQNVFEALADELSKIDDGLENPIIPEKRDMSLHTAVDSDPKSSYNTSVIQDDSLAEVLDLFYLVLVRAVSVYHFGNCTNISFHLGNGSYLLCN